MSCFKREAVIELDFKQYHSKSIAPRAVKNEQIRTFSRILLTFQQFSPESHELRLTQEYRGPETVRMEQSP